MARRLADSIPTFAVNAGEGGAFAEASDAGLACGHEQLLRVESADAAERCGAVEHPKAENREECASGRLECARCAQMGEAESVSQQEFSTSTGHGPRLAERAQMMLHACRLQ